jgi:Ca-activated chloride channel family protein
MVRRIAILLLAAGTPGVVAAGEANRFRVSSEMVLVNTSVVDSHGRPIAGLTKDNFRLFESHREKKIAWFSEDQAPVSMVIVFDTSGSMEGKLKRCAEAVAELLRSSQTGDEFALMTFSNQPQLVRKWTHDEAAIPAALLNERAHGTTAVIDALQMAGRYANTGSNSRKLIFVVSDGGDNSSRWRETQVLQQLQEMDLELYAVDIRESAFTPSYPGLAEGPGLLDRLCDSLSGRYMAVDRMGDLTGAVERIRREIRSQYVLGYRPGALERDGRFHPVEVKVAPPAGMHRISVRWRRGWREPQSEGAVE